jgi:hypothetical protein
MPTKKHYRKERAAHARDLGLAIFGATNADDVRMRRVIDRHIAADGNLSLAAKVARHAPSIAAALREEAQAASSEEEVSVATTCIRCQSDRLFAPDSGTTLTA